jgi:hypothetical protein
LLRGGHGAASCCSSSASWGFAECLATVEELTFHGACLATLVEGLDGARLNLKKKHESHLLF